MKKLLFISIVFLPLGLLSQTIGTIPQDIFEQNSCYENIKSYGLQEKSIDIDGEVFCLMIEHDSVGVNIVMSDKDEFQKLSDRISYELFGAQGNFDRIAEWKTMNLLFGNKINAEQTMMSFLMEGSIHLLCHDLSGQSYNLKNRIILDGKEIDAKRTARIILKELEDYDIFTKYSKRPLVVVIHACGVGGRSRNSFASRLSKYLAKESPIIYVIAAPGKIRSSVSTWPFYTETVIDEKGIVVNWNCFYKGKFISEGELDFATTIVKIQKEHLK